MIIYKVYEEETSNYGYCTQETEVKYYVNQELSEKDLRKRLEEWPSSTARIETITTED